jgi:alpha-glucoside transport system substrate-binding protein
VKDALAVMAEIVGNPDLIAGGTNGALQTDFNTSITQCFTDPPKAAIILEQDAVGGIISDETEAELGTDADFFDFPSIEGSSPAVVGGGDLGVLLTDNEAAKALLEYLATPEAATVRAELGGFISPNRNVDASVYPDEITRRAAEAFIQAGDEVRYDLSDLQPAAFGATTGQGIWGLFQDFIRNPDDIDGTAQKLEDAAAKAFE